MISGVDRGQENQIRSLDDSSKIVNGNRLDAVEIAARMAQGSGLDVGSLLSSSPSQGIGTGDLNIGSDVGGALANQITGVGSPGINQAPGSANGQPQPVPQGQAAPAGSIPQGQTAPQIGNTPQAQSVPQGQVSAQGQTAPQGQSNGVNAGATLNGLAQGQAGAGQGQGQVQGLAPIGTGDININSDVAGNLANSIAGGGSPPIEQLANGLSGQVQNDGLGQSSGQSGNPVAIQVKSTIISEANGQLVPTAIVQQGQQQPQAAAAPAPTLAPQAAAPAPAAPAPPPPPPAAMSSTSTETVPTLTVSPTSAAMSVSVCLFQWP